MFRKRSLGLALLLSAAIGILIPGSVNAMAIAASQISFSSLQIIPDSGTVVYLDSWTAEAFAQAQNSLGELDNQFDFSVGGMAMANAIAMFAIGHADAGAVSLTGNASGSLNIAGSIDAQAISIGRTTLFNSFMITGGSGPVDVDFSTDLTGLLHVFTDSFGQQAFADMNLSLQLDGDTVLFHHSELSVGPNSPSMTLPVATTLNGMRTLTFDTSYFVLVEGELDPMGIHVVPEPSTGVLFLLGLCYVGWLATKRRAGGKS